MNKQPTSAALPLPVIPGGGRVPTLASGWRRFSTDLARLARSAHVLSVADQMVVSGTSFLSAVIVGRACSSSEFGHYSLGLALVIGFISVMDPLITLPYAVNWRHGRATARLTLSHALTQFAVFSGLVVLVLGLAALVMRLAGLNVAMTSLLATLAVATPFILVREFGRQIQFAELSMVLPLLLDILVAVLQVGGLGYLALTGQLDATSACLVVAAACAIPAAIWIYVSRHRLASSSAGTTAGGWWPAFLVNWRIGKWMFATQLMQALKTNMIYWLIAFVGGSANTGIYAACMTIALLANPLVLGLANIMTPRAAAALASGGTTRLLRECVFDTAVLLVAIMGINVVLLFASDALIVLLFPQQPAYHAESHIAVLLALGLMVGALGLPPGAALLNLKAPQAVFWSGLWGTILTLLVAVATISDLGVQGAAYGLLVGNVFATLIRWGSLLAAIQRTERILAAEQSGPLRGRAVAAVEELIGAAGRDAIVLEPLGSGREADVFAAHLRSGAPIWQGEHSLAVKVFKDAESAVPDDLGRQVEAMRLLADRLGGISFDGWTVRVPCPLHLSRPQLAIVMTRVSGLAPRDVDDDAPLSSGDTLSLANALVGAMSIVWSTGEGHGDLQQHNIMCDVALRSIALLDPRTRVAADGTAAAEPIPGDSEREACCRRAAARDLAYLVYDIAVTVDLPLVPAAARRRKRQFVDDVLGAFFETLPAAERGAFVAELDAGARELLNYHLGRPASLMWLRNAFLTWRGRRRIDAVSQRLRGRLGDPGSGFGRDGSSAETGATGGAEERQRARMLDHVFAGMDRAGIPYCWLHGHEAASLKPGSDVDLLVSRNVTPQQVAACVSQSAARVGARLVSACDYHFILAATDDDGKPCLLDLDMTTDCTLRDVHFVDGHEVLSERIRCGSFWIPAPRHEFICLLVRRIMKGRLDDAHASRLSTLAHADVVGCRQQLERFWSGPAISRIVTAASTGNWTGVRSALDPLRSELVRGAVARYPVQTAVHAGRRLFGRLERIRRPRGGLVVLLLGPDGAGKSTVARSIEDDVGALFSQASCVRFPPGVIARRIGPPPGTETAPHGSAPRSPAASIVRAVLYWGGYYTVCYRVLMRIGRARGRLVIHDRHLVDAIVDPIRYRYGGPEQLLRLIWRLVPKPDLVFLLDAPAEVVQSRKREVPLAETARQREAYLALLRSMPNGVVVDGSQPLHEVTKKVREEILAYLARRHDPGPAPGQNTSRNPESGIRQSGCTT